MSHGTCPLFGPRDGSGLSRKSGRAVCAKRALGRSLAGPILRCFGVAPWMERRRLHQVGAAVGVGPLPEVTPLTRYAASPARSVDWYGPAAHPKLGSELVERSEEHTSELQSLMRISYAVFCLKKKNITTQNTPY